MCRDEKAVPEQRNKICNWCSEEVEEVKDFDLGTEILKVCDPCWEELKSEYGLIDGYDKVDVTFDQERS